MKESEERQRKMTDLNYKTITFIIHGETGHLMLNQPPSNQMNSVFFSEMDHFVLKLKEENSIKALVISGNGRHFSSGTPTDELINLIQEEDCNEKSFFFNNIKAFEYFYSTKIPVIAAVRGVCIGSAMELTMFCHFCFCGEDAVFGLPETTFNLIPGIGGISNILKLSGKAKAIELVLRGNLFPAKDALEFGIVDRILPKREVLKQAFDFAEQISENYKKDKKELYLKRYYDRIG